MTSKSGFMGYIKLSKRNDNNKREIAMKAVFNIGDKVNYHCFAGGNVTSSGHVVESISLHPNSFGEDVAWVSGKSGCISMEHLTEDKG